MRLRKTRVVVLSAPVVRVMVTSRSRSPSTSPKAAFRRVPLPAGALIYYVVSNLWRIGQQYATNYYMGPLVVRGQRSGEAERRMKRVGTGKTDAASGGKE